MAGKLTMHSTIGDVYETPVGHDLLSLLLTYLGRSGRLIDNPLVSHIRLSSAKSLAGDRLDDSTFETVLELANSETAVPVTSNAPITPAWWKEAVIYQIYPRSFCDSDGDGVGDLKGIISKLDYLKELGVDAIWLSPIYDSPNDDNGYDIRDYDKIMAEFGTMEDFEELLRGVHERGMKLIMDLVINHTSDEHEWYRKALADPASKYRDYYYFRNNGSDTVPPNNWESFFSGSAWNNVGGGTWALHLFSKKQMDLNWENPDMRADTIAMINRWLDRGVDGFRMDVINYISKPDGLPDGNPVIGSLTGYIGVEKYFYGPHLHEYLHEIYTKAFEPHGAFSVGETPGIGLQMAKLLTSEERGELNMIFNFDGLDMPGHTRMEDYAYDLNYLRDYFIRWQTELGTSCRMALFYNNHDNPRMISKVTKKEEYHSAVAKLLAVMQMTLLGTAFVFQGDEMGLANYKFTSIDQISDVESRNYYAEHVRTEDPKKVFGRILVGTREHGRVLLPWNKTRPDFHKGLDQPVKEDVRDVYRQLIAYRRGNSTILYGSFEVLRSVKNTFTYKRADSSAEIIVDCNLHEGRIRAYDPGPGFRQVFPQSVSDGAVLGPYEARIYEKKK